MCVILCVCLCVFVGQVQLSNFSLLGNMKPDKQRNYAASYSGESYTGRDGDTEEQIGSESRTRENLRDKGLTVGVFESI